MNIKPKRTTEYIYDPQLTDPRLDFYPPSSFRFDQEPFVAPLCVLARRGPDDKDAYLQDQWWY